MIIISYAKRIWAGIVKRNAYENVKAVSYHKSHEEIVEKGVSAIAEVLKGTNDAEKESLLFCLDKYLDPWFGYKLPYANEIFKLLEYVVIDTNTIPVKKDALQLLTDYAWPPFSILEENIDKIEDGLIEDVRYAINMDKE
jgi:hypothetical protein